ncbi:MAG: IS481 family transposase [Bacillota bacterium]
MNTHKNARLTFARRMELVRDMTQAGFSPAAAGNIHGVSATTARKWLGRFLALGEVGLADRSSRPKRSPAAIAPQKALAIVELRHQRLTHASIARALALSKSTVGRVLRRAGLSKLCDLVPAEPVRRYEHAAAGDMLHIDTKKLGRIGQPGHRVTGRRHERVRGIGWEHLFVAIDDHSRVGFTDIYPDDRKGSAEQFLRNCVTYFASLGVRVRRVLTDNGPAFRSTPWRQACLELGIKHTFTGPYSPKTNGKAERFIQSALREWAYPWVYQTSNERTDVLEAWIHHYNWHRPHQGIGGSAPMSRLKTGTNNLLTLHS